MNKTNSYLPFDALLKKLRNKYPGDKNKGKLGKEFEKLTVNFFKKDLTYKNRFSKVWFEKHYPKRIGGDTGIDIFAKERENDEIVGIQCKCYADNNPVDYVDVSKLVNACKKYDIKRSILVTTSDKLTAEVEATMQRDKMQLLNKSNFRASSIKNWDTHFDKIVTEKPKKLRTDQQKVHDDVINGFCSNDRGKMLMACGTGKTLTSLRITEDMKCKTILYLVPSISLIQQTMREWSDNSHGKNQYIAVCSDGTAGDDEGGQIYELERSPSTNKDAFVEQFKKRNNYDMTIIFSTYQSIDIVKEGLEQANDTELDLILCDEAHRTATKKQKYNKSTDKDESKDSEKIEMSVFGKVHEQEFIRSKKRLYMTATPKLYHGEKKDVFSMDDEKVFGPTFSTISFYDAVHGEKATLSDFKVKIAVLPEDRLPEYLGMMEHLSNESGDDDKKRMAKLLEHKAKYAAAWHGILKPDDEPMMNKPLQKIIVFTNTIEKSELFAGLCEKKKHGSFREISNEYNKHYKIQQTVDVRHIDGTTNSYKRRANLDWLDDSDSDKSQTRIISNARCLSEGVDVPSLDGVIFMEPKKSTVDVVQSVGRVMRKTAEKDFGYIILPVIVPGGNSADQILEDSRFQHVWEVLNALRSHDPRLIAELSSAGLIKNPDPSAGTGTGRLLIDFLGIDEKKEKELFSSLMLAMRSKIVKKVGNVDYAQKYGTKLGIYARKAEELVNKMYEKDEKMKKEIDLFHKEMQEIINETVTNDEVIKMIAQHVILKHVFDNVFYEEFISHNPVSEKLDHMLKTLKLGHILAELGDFYEDVRREADIIKKSPENEIHQRRQEFIKRIYGNFVSSVERKTAVEKGIVYTPTEMIDFIIDSVQYILKDKMGKTLGDDKVQVLEPFTGTGSFLTRLISSGLLDRTLNKKYSEQLFANEILLLGYYIAAVNIETTYSEHVKKLKRKKKPQNTEYVPFRNINYVDTFKQDPKTRNATEKLTGFMDEYSKKLQTIITKQNRQCIEVIMSNPPWGVAAKIKFDQKNKDPSYDIQSRVADTYGKKTKTGKKKLHELYVRALRWSSDRLGNCGIIAFVINGSLLKSPSFRGVRAYLHEEFNIIYYVDCRGEKGIKGDGRNIFEYKGVSTGGTTSRVGILFLIKTPEEPKHEIFYHKLNEKYYEGFEKRKYLKEIRSIEKIPDTKWEKIIPNDDYEWVEKSNDDFFKHTPMESKLNADGTPTGIFDFYKNGVVTGYDEWVYNLSRETLVNNMKSFIQYMNANYDDDEFKNKQDLTKGKWAEDTVNRLKDKGRQEFDEQKIRMALYRPFFKQNLYFDWMFNARWNVPEIMPQESSDNKIILVSWGKNFSALMTNLTPDLHVIGDNKCFPLYRYEKKNGDPTTTQGEYVRTDNINDQTLKNYREFYNDATIKKIDIFYYIYGVLHHPEYKKLFINNLRNNRPHIPMVSEFWKFNNIGEKLANLHTNFENFGTYHKMCNIKPLQILEEPPVSVKFVKKNDNHAESAIAINGIEIFNNLPEITYQLRERTPLAWFVERCKEYSKPYDGSKRTNNVFENLAFEQLIEKIKQLLHIGLVSEQLILQLPELEILDYEFENQDMYDDKLSEFQVIDKGRAKKRKKPRKRT